MSFEEIQLPPIVLQELFKFSLIELKQEEKPSSAAAQKKYFTLGNNLRKTLILVESEETLYLPDEQLNFLMGILAACSLTMEDVAILNIRKNEAVNYKTLTAELKPERILLFGVKPTEIELPIAFPSYQIQAYNNQTYLSAPTLSAFQDNKAEKVKLWNCLKQIFSI